VSNPHAEVLLDCLAVLAERAGGSLVLDYDDFLRAQKDMRGSRLTFSVDFRARALEVTLLDGRPE